MTSKSCFVIMPFSDHDDPGDNKWDDLYEYTIKPAVESTELGYTCHRSIDPHGNFMQDIVSHLVKADVVIAVLTELRPNVMYELGIRNTLKRKTIMLIDEEAKVPSDLSAYIALSYSTNTRAKRERLTRVIRDQLAVLDKQQTTIDNPVYEYLSRVAMEVKLDWYENKNPEKFLLILRQVLPDYALLLEPVLSDVLQLKNNDARESRVDLLPKFNNEHTSELSEMWTNLGVEFKNAHNLGRALECFEKAINFNPKNIMALGNEVLVLVQLGRKEEAIQRALKTIEIQPSSPASWNARGKALLALQRFAESADAFHEAFSLDNSSAVYANNIGIALEMNGDYEDALQFYQKAIELNPEYPHALYNRGMVLLRLDRKDEASESMHKALEIDAGIAGAIEAQRTIYSMKD